MGLFGCGRQSGRELHHVTAYFIVSSRKVESRNGNHIRNKDHSNILQDSAAAIVDRVYPVALHRANLGCHISDECVNVLQ